LENPSVAAARRSYRFVTIIAAVAGVLALVTLLLYLQARQRSQRIATALARRMGLGRVADAGALALEAGAVAAVAAVVGGLVAVLAAAPLIHRVDPLPLYAPTPEPVIPWLTLLGSSLVATAAGMLVGAAAAALAARADVAEALRVA
jgi:putative ABC transport system permease protein